MSQLLTERHTFTDDVALQIRVTQEGRQEEVIEIDDASNLVVAEFAVRPGAMIPWHTHPASSLVAMTQGELVYVYADDCIERTYPAGTALVDPGFDSVHMAFNPSDDVEATAVVTGVGVPEDGPVTVPVDDDEQARLNQKCGIER